MTENKNPKGRLQLALLALVFFGPLILATWLYFGGSAMQPSGRTNHGALLQPIVTLTEALPGLGDRAAPDGPVAVDLRQ